jgi:hypothetical protein
MIEDLLAKEEGKTLEFKENTKSLPKIIQTIVAFANTAGGLDNNPLIPSQKEQITLIQNDGQATISLVNTEPLVDQTLIAEGGHPVTFYNYKDKLWASVAIAGVKNKEYNALHAEIEV